MPGERPDTEPDASSAAPREAPLDPGRRRFFRTVGQRTVDAAGTVIGATDAVRRGAPSAAAEVLRLGFGDPGANAERLALRGAESVPGHVAAGPSAADAAPGDAAGGAASLPGFRSPYRVAPDGTLFLLDQRRAPAVLADVACPDVTAVANAMRLGIVRGAPVLAQVAAYALVLAAAASGTTLGAARTRRLSAAAAGLRAARPSARPVAGATERLLQRESSIEDEPLPAVVATLRAEADAIASEATVAHATLARLAVDAFPAAGDRPLHVLLHGDGGALSGGTVGTGIAALEALVRAGRPVRVSVTEARPTRDGRLAAWQLGLAGIEATIVPDAAVGQLVAQRRPDVVLLAAESVARCGDVAALVGALTVAVLARRAGVPVLVAAPTVTVDPEARDGGDFPHDPVPAEARTWDAPSTGGTAGAWIARTDVVPAELVATFLTEHGPATLPPAPAEVRTRGAA